MILEEDLIFGSVLEAACNNFPAVVKGGNKKGISILHIIYHDGIPQLERGIISKSDLKYCNPVLFSKPNLFIKFENYDFIVRELKKKGYILNTEKDNTRSIIWKEGDSDRVEKFDEVHLFQKFIFGIIGEYLEASI